MGVVQIKANLFMDAWIVKEYLLMGAKIYVGDIEITFESVYAIQTSIKHENEYLVVVEEETISTSPSPMELHEVGPSKKEEDEEVHLQEPHFLEGSLNMNENKIQ